MTEKQNCIQRFVRRLEEENVCMHGFILSVGGRIRAQAYYAPFAEGQPHRLYSISKTMTALAIGILLDEDKIGLDDPICDHFRDLLPESPDPRLLRLTVRQMLAMQTCFSRTAYREGVDDDWTTPFFRVPPDHEPGTCFQYDTGCSQVLAALTARKTGMQVMDFLNERVFKPCGLTDERYWLRDPSGTCQGGTGLCMSLRDLHRVARLVMEGGRGIIPRWFCEEMVKCHSINLLHPNREERSGYGWQVWRTRNGWAMYGMGGQLAIACPEKDLLLCTVADTRLDPIGTQRIHDAFFEEVYPCIDAEDGPSVTLSLAVQPVDHDPVFTMAAAGPFLFADNPLKLRSVELRGNTLLWENERGKNELRFGLGENIVDSFPGWPERPMLSSGGWVAEGVLHVRCHIIGDAPCGVDMLLFFSGQCLTVQSRKSSDPATNVYEGVASGYLA